MGKCNEIRNLKDCDDGEEVHEGSNHVRRF